MAEFNAPVDIGNRGLDHVGSPAMGSAGFAENSKRAGLVSRCYGKLRRAELRRNTWAFATKSAAIRPVDTNTLKLTPTLWSSSVTYFVGSIVQDSNGTLWQSNVRDNLNNPPTNTSGANVTGWEPYFGPLTAEPFDSSKSYFAGELAYTLSGAGTFNIFASLVSGNAVHPALPNQWSIDTIYMKDQVVQQFPAWSSLTTYTVGQGALYTDGNVYVSLVNSNLNLPPPSNGASWALMPTLILASQLMPTSQFAQPTLTQTTPIDEWNIEQVYSLGSFVVFNATVYLSIAANNTGNYPNASGSTSWAAVTQGTTYQSLIDLNQGNSPASAPALWASGTTYAINNLVGGSDGNIYKSTGNSNLGNNPVTDGGVHWTNTGVFNPWTTVFTLGNGNSQWIQIGGSAFPNGVGLTALNIIYPAGTGPFSQTWSRNVYRLPAGYIRRAPQMPAAGRSSWLGFPGNLTDTDWELKGDLLITMDGNPIVLRFIADVQNVLQFDDMFCEGLACRIALEVCEPLTQSTAKLNTIAQIYQKFMTEARTVGGIETRADEPPLDDYIACRI